MLRWPGIFSLLLFCAFRASAIDAAVAHNLFFTADPAHAGSLRPTIELYWQVNPHTVHFKTTLEKNIIAAIRTDVVLSNEQGIITQDHFIVKTSPKTNPEDLARISILELRRYALATGKVKLTLRMTDIGDTNNRYSYADSFTVSQPEKTAFYSEVQLLDTSTVSDATTAFNKNGRLQIPLCANFLDEQKRVLHYYGELYGLNNITPDEYPLIQKINIGRKQNDLAVSGFLKVDTIHAGQPAAVSGSFPVNTLASGNYYVNITLENNLHKVLATGSTFFQRLNRHPDKEEVEVKKEKAIDTGLESVTYFDLDKTFLVKYNLNQVKSILKMLLPVSDPLGVSTINNFLKKPDEMYMRYYIYNHFLAINKKDPAKAWKEFSEQVIDVNKRFNFQSKPGYETDRGAIYMRYGAPTDVITVNNETGTLPYEIWQYNVLTQLNKKDVANALFLFYKPDQMLGDYRLLHSTVYGEAMNMSWRTYLYTNGNTGVNTSTRAEDYIGTK